MGCPPVRGDNPRALASGLSYVQVDKHGITIYTTYICVDLAHDETLRAKVGKGGISTGTATEQPRNSHGTATNMCCCYYLERHFMVPKVIQLLKFGCNDR